jgi:hypothetical protein
MSLVAAGIAVFFSSFTTVSLSVLLSVGVYLIGTNLSQLESIARKSDNPAFSALMKNIKLLFPNFELFLIGPRVTYNLKMSPEYMFGVAAYGVLLIFIFLALSSVWIEKKEV